MRLKRSLAGLATAVLVGVGLVAVPAGAAVADSAPIEQGIDPTVTADALPTVQIDGVAWSQVVVGNTVYVGGDFTTARPAGSAAGVNTVARANLLAYDLTTGELKSGWNASTNGPVYAIDASPDGSRIYVGGDFNKASGAGRSRFAALDPNTGAALNVMTGGTNGVVRAIDVASDGTVYLGGTFNTVFGSARVRVAGITASGALTALYANVQSRIVYAVAVSGDGKRLYIGGAFEKVNEVPRLGTAALATSNGALLSWDISDQMYTHGSEAGTYAMATDGNDQVYGTAYAYYSSGEGLGNNEGVYAVGQTSGRITWMTDCHGDTYSVFPVPGEDNVYISGHPHMCNNNGGYPEVNPRHFQYATAVSKHVASLVTTNTQVTDYYENLEGFGAPEMWVFFPEFTAGTYTGQGQATWSVTGNSQYVVYGGEFKTVNGTAQQGLVRFAKNPIAPGKVGPTQAASTLKPAVQSMGRGTMSVSWLTASDPDNKWLTYTVLRNGVAVGTVTAASKFWNRPHVSFLDTGLANSTSYTYSIRATDATGNSVTSTTTAATTLGASGAQLSTYAQTVLNDNPNTYYRLGETSGNFEDSTSWSDATAGSSGITRNVAGAVAGDSNGAARFNGGSNARVYSNNQEAGQDNLSIEAWFKTTTGGGKIVGFGSTKGVGNSSNYDRHIYMGSDGRLTFGVYPGSVRTVTSPNGYADGAWHQVVATLGSAGMKLYVDGQLVAQNADVTHGQASFNGYWRIGGDQVSSWPNSNGNAFVGDIDEVSTYGRQLSDLDVLRHYGIATTGTVPNAAPTASFTVTGGVLTASTDASASTDADGTIAEYQWAWGDGQTSTTSTPTATHTYAAGGPYTVSLTVKDDDAALSAPVTRDVDVKAPNQAPTASFTATPNYLAVAFDASASKDPDGTIAQYRWVWDDGQTSTTTTPTASHTYLVPDTYHPQLTVVDNEGLASAVTTVSVTAQAAPGAGDAVAADSFSRSVASGWGTADLGGDWVVSSGVGSVANGVGVLSTAAGATPSARLPGWSGTSAVTTLSSAWSARATGASAFTLLRGRITPGGEYRLKSEFKTNGAIEISLARTNSSGTSTRLGSLVTVPGTYAAGTVVHQKLEVSGTSPTTVRAKVWVGDTEPASWQVSVTDSTAALQVAGHTGLASQASAGTTNAPLSLSVDDYTVTAP